jgi:hypothetical protein
MCRGCEEKKIRSRSRWKIWRWRTPSRRTLKGPPQVASGKDVFRVWAIGDQLLVINKKLLALMGYADCCVLIAECSIRKSPISRWIAA